MSLHPNPAERAALVRRAEESLVPLAEHCVRPPGLAGLAVGIVHGGETVFTRGFGVANVTTGTPVTPETVFGVASLSKPVVATAVVALALALADRRTPDRAAALDLDAPVVTWVPEFTLADGRAAEITARHLLSHTSGLPDVVDYHWHDPDRSDDALGRAVGALSRLSLRTTPGSTFFYSSAGFDVLGHLVATLIGTTFEAAVERLVLNPVGMRGSTFLRGDVPPEPAASPHVGVPLTVPRGVYPENRSHAPSSGLHSSVADLCLWMLANLGRHPTPLDSAVIGQLRQPVAAVGSPPWEEAVGLAWFLGSYREHPTVSHVGAIPGFSAHLTLVPSEDVGVVVLANSNTTPTGMVASAALDVVLDVSDPSGAAADEGHLPDHGGQPEKEPEGEMDDEALVDATWGAVELHRTELVRPLLERWTNSRPDSSWAWTMTGWASAVDGDPGSAKRFLERALALDAGNDHAALLRMNLSALGGGPPAR